MSGRISDPRYSGGGSGGGSVGPAVDQDARNTAAAAQAAATDAQTVNGTQTSDIAGLRTDVDLKPSAADLVQAVAARALKTEFDTLAGVVGGKASSQAVTDLATSVSTRNDSQDASIALKANADAVTTALAGKVGTVAYAADKAALAAKDQEHDAAIALKADAAATTLALSGKVATTTFTAFSDAVTAKNDGQDTEIGRRAIKTDVDTSLADKASNASVTTQKTRIDGIIGADGSTGRLKDAETAVSTIQSDLNTAGTGVKAKVSAHTADLADVHDQLDHAGTGVKARVSTIETDLNTVTTGIKAKVAAHTTDLADLHDQLDNVATGVKAKVASNTSAIAGLAALTGAVFLGKARIKVSGTNIDVDSLKPANIGTVTEVGYAAGGGGASGLAFATSSTGITGNFGPGGHPGQIARRRRRKYVAGTKLDVVIGAGGARALATGTAATVFVQNAGSDTTVSIKNSFNAAIGDLLARGGFTWSSVNLSSGQGNPTSLQLVVESFPYVDAPQTSGLPGRGDGQALPVRLRSGQNFVDGPTGGGGCSSVVSTGLAAAGGSGGTVYYSGSPEGPFVSGEPVSAVVGALGSNATSATVIVAAEAGKNPYDEAGTYGTGGGGGKYASSTLLSAGGDGGFPCGGGGGHNVANGNTATGGKGGDGYVDVFFYGIPPAA